MITNPRRNIMFKQPTVVVQVYKGERALRAGVAKMSRKGWMVQDRTSRKKLFSIKTGIFTRQQIHTVTFVQAVQT
jgi:DNA-binding transcriptional regulator PaaX